MTSAAPDMPIVLVDRIFVGAAAIGRRCGNVSADTAIRLIRAGKLRAFQVTPGGPWRCRRSEIDRFMATIEGRR